jgi:hypothetical protein
MNTLTIRFLSMALLSVTSNVSAETLEHSAHAIVSGLVQLSDDPAHLSHTWTGIGRLRGPRASYCTASLIDTRKKGQPSATSPAYIITSQRCLNSSNEGNYAYDGGVQKNVPIEGNVYFNNFENTLGHTKKYAFKSIAWQSDNGLNLAIIELRDTLSNLMKAGVQPLTIASATPPAGTEILTLGIPHTSNLYATSCTQMPHVDVLGHPWVSPQMLPNHCAALTEGGRGAAVLDKARNELISLAVASTHGTHSVNKCQALSPCEIKDNASLWSANTHYTLPVSFLNQCFSDGVFTHDLPGCSLKNQAASLLKDPHSFPARLLERTSANSVTWDHASPFSEHYEYKHGPYASTDCSDPKGYEAVIDMNVWIANFLASGTVDANLYSEVDLSSDASKRIMGHLDGVRSHKKLGHNDDTVKLCTIVYNQENIPSPPFTHIFKQL